MAVATPAMFAVPYAAGQRGAHRLQRRVSVPSFPLRAFLNISPAVFFKI